MTLRDATPGTVTITADVIAVHGWTFTGMDLGEGKEVALWWAFRRLAADPAFRAALTEAVAEGLHAEAKAEGWHEVEVNSDQSAAAIVAHMLGE